MIVDLLWIAIFVIFLLIGLRAGVLKMLGRLVIFLLSIGVTLILTGPFVRFLAGIPWFKSLSGFVTSPLFSSIEQTRPGVEGFIEQLALSPFLEKLFKRQLGSSATPGAETLPEISSALFQFVLSAFVFLILLIVISLLVNFLTGLLSKISDSLPVVGFFKRLGGMVAGAALGLMVINTLLLLAGLLSPFFGVLNELLSESVLSGPLNLTDILSHLF